MRAKPLTIVVVLLMGMLAGGLLVIRVRRYMPQRLKDISTDVSQRLMSPDRSWMAFLIRRFAFDLNFAVVVRKSSRDNMFNTRWDPSPNFGRNSVSDDKVLFRSKDYDPDPKDNWNERLAWSADSSMLLLRIDEPEAFVWAYDFNAEAEVTDPNAIESLWQQRNRNTVDGEAKNMGVELSR